MGQGNNKLIHWVEKAQDLEKNLEQITQQLNKFRNTLFDLAEIPHLRDLEESNFKRDVYLIENAINYMNQCYSQKHFIQETSSNLKKVSQEILSLKTLLFKSNKKYEKLLKQYSSYQRADELIQNLIQAIDWKRLALINYFSIDKQEFDECYQQTLYDIKSESSIGSSGFNSKPQLKKLTSLE